MIKLFNQHVVLTLDIKHNMLYEQYKLLLNIM